MRKSLLVSPLAAFVCLTNMVALTLPPVHAAEVGTPLRRIVSLDGTWEIAEGAGDGTQAPTAFPAKIPVPGLVDLARPRLVELGTPKSYFWYRRTFTVDGPVRAVALL